MMKDVLYISGMLVTLSLLAGCGGGSSLDLHPVTGTVTYDGQPIEDGRIQFRSLEGDQRSFSGKIQNGTYAIETFTGPMRVEVRASRLIPGKFDESNPGEKAQMGEMYIPERYNSRSELNADITSGANTVNFDLTSA